jgi:plasmid stabilization system protein ParE
MRKAFLQQKAKEDVRETALYIADVRKPEEEVEIFRVLHGARDVPVLLL